MGLGSNPSVARGGSLRRGQMGLAGLDKMLRTLNTTKDRTVKKCARAGLLAGMTPVTKAIRAEINNSTASSPVKKAARKTVGKSMKKIRGQYVAKVGLGVGRMTKKQKEKAHAHAGGGGGVGISKRNIYWFVFGTPERLREGGKSTGNLKAVLKGVVPRAVASASGAMFGAMQRKITQVLARETAKARK